MPFDDLEEDLDPKLASQLLSVAEIPVEGITGGSLAMALTRPGPATVTDVDRARARTLLAASRAHRLKVWPMHLATKNCVRMLTVDDLLASP
ncbi:MAG: hypothetical protein H0T91_10825 [Propionibacteriaceae bacterium]|nr:hypothetical protein [Propionibacteriaceae bacterium]